MAVFSSNRPKWGDSFIIDDGEGDGFIRLAQAGRKSFRLESSIEYAGETGLEDRGLDVEAMKMLRRLDPSDLDETDLASIPAPMRWWVNTYGVHTPPALIHDRFIGGELPKGVTEADVDRYFRFMLKDSGVRFLKRWIMWSATALRTRALGGGMKTASVVLWAVLAILGTVGLVVSVASGQWVSAAVLGVVAPAAMSTLWGKQFGAGLVAAWLVVPWLVPPLLVTSVFLVFYVVAETALRLVLNPSNAGSEPVLWTNDDERSERLQNQAENLADGEISTEARAV